MNPGMRGMQQVNNVARFFSVAAAARREGVLLAARRLRCRGAGACVLPPININIMPSIQIYHYHRPAQMQSRARAVRVRVCCVLCAMALGGRRRRTRTLALLLAASLAAMSAILILCIILRIAHCARAAPLPSLLQPSGVEGHLASCLLVAPGGLRLAETCDLGRHYRAHIIIGRRAARSGLQEPRGKEGKGREEGSSDAVCYIAAC